MNRSHATKSCVFILLVALLCAERAQGLECYNCKEVPLETSCPSITCPYTGGFCIYQEVEVIVDSHRSKVKNSLCLPFCLPNIESPEFLGTTLKVNTSCCQEDLCNAATPVGGNTWTLAGVLLSSLGSVLLQTLL